jgi:hyperosmotically inducible periplasmic protein
MSGRAGAVQFLILLAAGLLIAHGAGAQFNPLSVVGSAVSTALDARSKAEVANDAEIAAGANKHLLEDKRAEWKGVTLLVFAQRVVLAGAVQSDEAKKIVADVVKQDNRIRALDNALVVIQKAGDDGSFFRDKTIDTKIDAALTAAKGVSSVNMRWKTVNGNVTVMGIARSAAEAATAVARIRSVDGVKNVKSFLRVQPAH